MQVRGSGARGGEGEATRGPQQRLWGASVEGERRRRVCPATCPPGLGLGDGEFQPLPGAHSRALSGRPHNRAPTALFVSP